MNINEHLKKIGFGLINENNEIIWDGDKIGTDNFRNYWFRAPEKDDIDNDWWYKALYFACYWIVDMEKPRWTNVFLIAKHFLHEGVAEKWDDAMDYAWSEVYNNKEFNRVRMINKKRFYKLINYIAKQINVKASATFLIDAVGCVGTSRVEKTLIELGLIKKRREVE